MVRLSTARLLTQAVALLALGAPALAADKESPVPKLSLPAQPPQDLEIDISSYWGNARKRDSGGNFRLTLSPKGGHYTAKEGATETEDFYFSLTPAEWEAAYKLASDNKVGELPATEKMVHDSFGDQVIRVISPSDPYVPHTIEIDAHNNANNRIEDPRWKVAFGGLRAMGEAWVKRKQETKAFPFELQREPGLKVKSINNRIAGARNIGKPIQLLPGKYKVSIRVWPEDVPKYDESKLLPWDGEVSIPEVKALSVNVLDGKVKVTEVR